LVSIFFILCCWGVCLRHLYSLLLTLAIVSVVWLRSNERDSALGDEERDTGEGKESHEKFGRS
jgi:hypothetical protein